MKAVSGSYHYTRKCFCNCNYFKVKLRSLVNINANSIVNDSFSLNEKQNEANLNKTKRALASQNRTKSHIFLFELRKNIHVDLLILNEILFLFDYSYEFYSTSSRNFLSQIYLSSFFKTYINDF